MRTLIDEVRRRHPGLEDPESFIRGGDVLVDGIPVTNPRSQVRPQAAVTIRRAQELRGSVKLRAALDAFGVDPAGRVCLDVGAAAGGFTAVLLERGAARVYAVDVGHGQLLGSLRQDVRVVNLEDTNVAELDRWLVPEPISLVTVDVSYLSLSAAASQLGGLQMASGADLVGLVKPMFELRLAEAPTDAASVERAIEEAGRGIEAAGWDLVGVIPSPVTGAKGAVEALLHARLSGEPSG